jgi:transposase
MALWDTIPGVSQRTAESLRAELGTDMTQFPHATHLASWAGMGPGHHESAGQRLSGQTRQGRRWRRQVLVEAAPVAAKPKQTDLAAPYQRMAARRGKTRALMALGPTILIMVYSWLTRQQPSHDLGTASFDTLEQHRVHRRLVPR